MVLTYILYFLKVKIQTSFKIALLLKKKNSNIEN